MMTYDRQKTPPYFPMWRGLSLVEDLVVAAWQDSSPSALQTLISLSADELAALVDIFETFVVAAHFLTDVTTKLAETAGPKSHQADPSANSSRSRSENESLTNAAWALREFLALIECLIALLNGTEEEARLASLERRVSLYDRTRLTWLTRAGETVLAACGLVLTRAAESLGPST